MDNVTLATPIAVKGIELHNRLVMPPMATMKADDGFVTDEIVSYYDEKTKDGCIGLVVMEHCYIAQPGMAHLRQVSVSRDDDVAGLKRVADVIHANGSRAIIQLSHAGSSARREVIGMQPVAPSAVANVGGTGDKVTVPRELTVDEIAGIVADFAAAAKRAKAAGFDGVEIHSAHAYLLNQFYSPLTNRRTDGYGGDLMGRIHIHLEVIAAIRAAVGEGFIIALRLGAADYMEGGSTAEDGAAACVEFEKAGLDLIDVSGGMCGTRRPGHDEEGYFAELSAAIKARVSVPVIVTGGIVTGKAANELLAAGKTDMIGVGRAILKDSSWARNNI